jgi:cellulose synthase/poly-beta-1,6-N-acetylglucosamine synthase-like glycosyltransferase
VCLKALAAQTLSKERFEVIVCDDGSEVPLASTLQNTLATLGNLRVSFVSQQNAGPAAARNRAADAAQGKYLAFTDDDCRPATDWLDKLLQHFEGGNNALIGGGMCAASTSSRYARATQRIMNFVYADQARSGGMLLFSTSNLAMNAQAFRDVGGFSTRFRLAAGEDYDLCARWYHEGGELMYVPEALIVHDPPLTFGGFLRQHFRYGRGLLLMRKRLKERGGAVRPGQTPGSFHLRLIVSPINARPPFGLGWALLIALAQFATVAGVVAEVLFPAAGTSAVVEPTKVPGEYA